MIEYMTQHVIYILCYDMFSFVDTETSLSHTVVKGARYYSVMILLHISVIGVLIYIR